MHGGGSGGSDRPTALPLAALVSGDQNLRPSVILPHRLSGITFGLICGAGGVSRTFPYGCWRPFLGNRSLGFVVDLSVGVLVALSGTDAIRISMDGGIGRCRQYHSGESMYLLEMPCVLC